MHMLFSKALATQSFICYVCRKELQGSIELMRLIKQDFYYSFTFLGFILFQVTFNSYVGRLFFLTFKKKINKWTKLLFSPSLIFEATYHRMLSPSSCFVVSFPTQHLESFFTVN